MTETDTGVHPTPELLTSLSNILTAYVNRNPSVGYCQGLNFIVAHLLKYLSEEESFWVFCCLIESILPLDYYSGMLGILVDQKILCSMIAHKMKPLSAHLTKLNLDPSLVTLQWFICLFSYNLQPVVEPSILQYFP